MPNCWARIAEDVGGPVLSFFGVCAGMAALLGQNEGLVSTYASRNALAFGMACIALGPVVAAIAYLHHQRQLRKL